MIREYQRKGKIKGGPWNKGSGIIGELIFDFILNQCEIPHIRTEPLLSKNHPVNEGKKYDSKIGKTTIDIKTLPPRLSGQPSNLNVNYDELGEEGKDACDIYILIELAGNLTNEEIKEALELDKTLRNKIPIEEFKEKRARLEALFDKIKKARFLGWTTKDKLIKRENVKQGHYGSYYSLRQEMLNADFELLDDLLGINMFKALLRMQ